ncbi:MAG: 50S ribosomal protein L11 methyltransferase [Bacteroidetes bacterium]|nr:50S ribosomal protein L11 methyltransferase [Bacteroidota bacterium]
MDYIELEVKIDPRQPGCDLLITELAELGFESFADTEEGFLAYVPQHAFNQRAYSLLNDNDFQLGKIQFEERVIAHRNWNAEWEKDFEPVMIGNDLLIRAPFHLPGKNFRMEIVIQPQQSFGTGHHETTRLMAQKLLTLPLGRRYILDMGCGTGILAILAEKCGAQKVLAVDIDENAVQNSQENILRNNCSVIKTICGNTGSLDNEKFNVILANINKNILLSSMDSFAKHLHEGGDLLLSGFFTQDADELKRTAKENKLIFKSMSGEGEWALLHFEKN